MSTYNYSWLDEYRQAVVPATNYEDSDSDDWNEVSVQNKDEVDQLMLPLERMQLQSVAQTKSKDTKITMVLSVSYKAHSNFIGNKGEKIKRLIRAMNCRIQFPSNKHVTANKSNAVILYGDINNISQARAYLRKYTPLLISFRVSYMTVEQSNNLLYSKRLIDIQSDYKIKTGFYCNKQSHNSYVRFVTNDANEENTILCYPKLKQLFFWTDSPLKIQTKLFLEDSEQQAIFHRDGSNLAKIISHTSTSITRMSGVPQHEREQNAVRIEADKIEDLITARKLIMALLPIELRAEIPEDKFRDDSLISARNFIHNVNGTLAIKKMRNKNAYIVTLKCAEYYLDELYMCLQIILNGEVTFNKPEFTFQCPIVDNFFCKERTAKLKVPSNN